MSEVSNRRFVHFSGTREEFEAGGYGEYYPESIVFINANGDEYSSIIYTHGEYYGNGGVISKGDVDNSGILIGEYDGYKNRALSKVSLAIGAASTAGLKGWYYKHVNISKKQIFLGSSRTKILGVDSLTCTSTLYPDSKYTDSSFVSGYEVGDVISIVYNSKYEDYATITAISGNVLTLDKIPFVSGSFVLGVCKSVIATDPDEFSVYCIKYSYNETTKQLTVSKYDAGGVDFGGGALAEGVNNYALNIGAHAEGIQTVAKGQYSHTEGFKTIAGYASHAEGKETEAIGEQSHAEGTQTYALGNNSHVEGKNTYATNYSSHAEGYGTVAGDDITYIKYNADANKGCYTHAEGNGTRASGTNSHAEGGMTKSSGYSSHAEGNETIATGHSSHAEGYGTVAGDDATDAKYNDNPDKGAYTHAEGNGTRASGHSSHAEGRKTESIGNSSHSEGLLTKSYGNTSHAEGNKTNATGSGAHAEGYGTVAGLFNDVITSVTINENGVSGSFAHAEGNGTHAEGESSHAEGHGSVAAHRASHAEGFNTRADASGSHAEGGVTIASGTYSHAEGHLTTAEQPSSHAEGGYTIASGVYSHAEGYTTTACGEASHAEGLSENYSGKYIIEDGIEPIIADWTESKFSLAFGKASHVEGQNNIAFGRESHAEGENNIAEGNISHAQGRKNIARGSISFVCGDNNISGAFSSFTGGQNCINNGSNSIVYGLGLTIDASTSTSCAVFGKYNANTNKNTLFCVGNGSSDNTRSNAMEIQTNGTVLINGLHHSAMPTTIYNNNEDLIEDSNGYKKLQTPSSFQRIVLNPYNYGYPKEGMVYCNIYVSELCEGSTIDIISLPTKPDDNINLEIRFYTKDNSNATIKYEKDLYIIDAMGITREYNNNRRYISVEIRNEVESRYGWEIIILKISNDIMLINVNDWTK